MSEPRHYPVGLTNSECLGVSVSDLNPGTYAMLMDLAVRSETSRSFVARSILEGIETDKAAEMVAARRALRKPRARHAKVLRRRSEFPRKQATDHDRICAEINGEIPNGVMCTYPNCDCK